MILHKFFKYRHKKEHFSTTDWSISFLFKRYFYFLQIVNIFPMKTTFKLFIELK